MSDDPRTSTGTDEQARPGEPRSPGKDPLRRSRTSRAWLALSAFGIVLVLLIVFIAQNIQSVQVSFLGWDWHAPLAVALLVAAAAAILVTAVAGTLRILQLRRRIGREGRRRK
jgi:uncharacterized integral membrane protein